MVKKREKRRKRREKEEKGIQFNVTEEDVRFHLKLLQNIIQRMADSSSSVKKWCITVVSGLMMFSIRFGTDLVIWSLGPILMFFLMDMHYNALEKKFIDNYDCFVKRLHNIKFKEKFTECATFSTKDYVEEEEIFTITPPREVYKYYLPAFLKLEICLFYLSFVAFVVALYFLK